tara:strand:+ start:30 stop:263 length:234 start_codon:yes stop_codon:yes gene_type:complete
MSGEVYVKTQEQFDKAKEISLEVMPILQAKSEGEFLVTLQVLDLLQDIVIKQAMEMKSELDQKRDTLGIKGGSSDYN